MKITTIVRRCSFVLLLPLVACNPFPPPTPEQVAKADYGTLPENYQERIKAFMASRLFDPYSAVFEFKTPPQKGYYYAGGQLVESLAGYKHVAEFGYFVTVEINAKNRFGGYAGAGEHLFFLRNDEIKSCYYPGSHTPNHVQCRPDDLPERMP